MKENEKIRRFAEALKVAISCIEDCEYASQKVCNSRIDAAITSWREYVEANNIDNLMKETKEERTSTDYLTVSPRGGSKTTYQANIFKTICEMGSGISRYESINAKFIQLTGHSMNDLLEMFAAGYTLTPPKQQDLANISASIIVFYTKTGKYAYITYLEDMMGCERCIMTLPRSCFYKSRVTVESYFSEIFQPIYNEEWIRVEIDRIELEEVK